MTLLTEENYKNELFGTRLRTLFSKIISIYPGSESGVTLIIHRIASDDQNRMLYDIDVKKSCLKGTIRYYTHHNFECVSLNQVIEKITHTPKDKRKYMVFALDDGYMDTLTTANLHFKNSQIPFKVYITSTFPDRTASLWLYALMDLVTQSRHINFIFNGYVYDYFSETRKEKENTYNTIKNFILNTESSDLNKLLSAIFL